MTQHDLADLLGKAFAEGKTDALTPHLAKKCIYISDYADVRVVSAEKTIERMKHIYENLDDTTRYSYATVQLREIADLKKVRKKGLSRSIGVTLSESGLYLFQYSTKVPVAVVFFSQNRMGKICEIRLSRDRSLFDFTFYGEPFGTDSPFDLPYSVEPKTLRTASYITEQPFSHLYDKIPEEEKANLYIWQQANIFIQDWLDNHGFYVYESQIQEDCIGYRCKHEGDNYTVYMYAYGQTKTRDLDGEFCEKLTEKDFSKDSTVLVVYLNVKRKQCDGEILFDVYSHSGNENLDIELWKVTRLNGKPVLQFFPGQKMIGCIYRLVHAFNRDSLDLYDLLVTKYDPAFEEYENGGMFFNLGFYGSLKSLHEKYGDMKIGYVRFNDFVYSCVPYLDGYGFFHFRAEHNMIHTLVSNPFVGGERPCKEFIRTEETLDSFAPLYPKLISVTPFAPVKTERFALKLLFETGEIKKYVLPTDLFFEDDETVTYDEVDFSDTVWQTAKIVDSHKSEHPLYPDRGQAVAFDNGFYLSAIECYERSLPYSEPILLNETVYEDDKIALRRLWRWDVDSIYEDGESGLIKALISGVAFNWRGRSTLASPDGKRLTSLEFSYYDGFHDGLTCVGLAGKGLGYVDENGNLIIFDSYFNNANEFINGRALVSREGRSYYIDKSGQEIALSNNTQDKYQTIMSYREGLCRVSSIAPEFLPLAYYSEHERAAGIWGFVDENGNEIVSPQYIFAYDFENGLARVCKGEWTIDEKWDNEYNTGRYWTEEELWGVIDKTGKEVIPCLYDEIECFWDNNDVFKVHCGGWKEGKWGIMSKTGEWLVEPTFENIGDDFTNGLFAFYNDCDESEDDLFGVYDANQHSILFEPQFLDVSFLKDGTIKVEVFDETLERNIEKIIDTNGKELFPSEYSDIYTFLVPYEVSIRDESGTRRGLIAKDGTVLVPCKYYSKVWNGFSYEKKRAIISQGDKEILIDFEDHILIPAKQQIHGLDDPLLTFRDGDKEGLADIDGTIVLPPTFDRIQWGANNRILCSSKGNCEMLELVIKNNA